MKNKLLIIALLLFSVNVRVDTLGSAKITYTTGGGAESTPLLNWKHNIQGGGRLHDISDTTKLHGAP